MEDYLAFKITDWSIGPEYIVPFVSSVTQQT